MLKYVLASGISVLLLASGTAMAYQSTYDNIQWEPRDSDTSYCIDITDENWNIYPDLKAVDCGEHLYNFSPRTYVRKVMQQNPDELHGLTFRWRIRSAKGYGGKGFEGEVTVGSGCGLPHRSDAESVQWGCRFDDTFYCLDLFDADGRIVKAPLVCGENMHSFSPRNLKRLDLPSGAYHWKVWSHNAYDYNGHQEFFEGKFEYNKQDSNGSAEWENDNQNGSVTWHVDDGNGSAEWENDDENGSTTWTNDDSNGSAEWKHDDKNGSVTWTNDDGNGSAKWKNGDKCGSVEWDYNKWIYGSGSVNWQYDDECN